jgi:putative salt-induced outer membrane protein
VPRILLLPVFLFLLSAALQAQEPPEEAPEPPVRPWAAGGEISYVATSGNSDTRTVGASAEYDYKGDLWGVTMKSSFVDAESEGEQQARVINALAAVSRQIFGRFDSYARSSYMKNRFAGIDQRITIEGGAAWDVLTEGPHILRLETGLGHTTEERLTVRNLSFATLRGGVHWRWRLTENSTVGNNFSLTRNLESSADWRVTNMASITAALNARFALKFAHSIDFLNEPVPGFERLDTTTSTALVVRF